MALSDLVARLLSRPARRVVDAPVRSLVDQALETREVPSAAEISRLRAQLDDRTRDLDALSARVDGLAELVSTLEQENRDLRAEVARAHVPTEPCAVEACTSAASDGAFCSVHEAAWRGGELDGHVGPDGHVRHGDALLRVQTALAGQPVVVTGKKRLTVKVAGKRVSFRAVT
ncbi:MAG: hypothetical protein GY913_18675 [Proteobacteria bacterium]|nr:hypothetical protein [Pseudomonadota bacterium]MCP4918935.1 hypothetical protein [Pseudomonadota bacterium]